MFLGKESSGISIGHCLVNKNKKVEDPLFVKYVCSSSGPIPVHTILPEHGPQGDICLWLAADVGDKISYDTLSGWIYADSKGHKLIFAHGNVDLQQVVGCISAAPSSCILVTDAQTLNRNGFFVHSEPFALERQITECLENLDRLKKHPLEPMRGLRALVIFLSTAASLIIHYTGEKRNGLLVYAPNVYTAAKKPLNVLGEYPQLFEGAMAALVRNLLKKAQENDPLGLMDYPVYYLSSAIHDAILFFSLAFDGKKTYRMEQKDQLLVHAVNTSELMKLSSSEGLVQKAIDFIEHEDNGLNFLHPVHIPIDPSFGPAQPQWSMYDCLGIDGFDIARIIMRYGVDEVRGLPVLARGAFCSFDQKEALSVLRIERLIESYLENSKADKPLNLAIFGSPGSGKSFFLKELIRGLNEHGKENKLPQITFHTFNLSQVKAGDDSPLNDMFQKIRDDGVNKNVPLLFIDEFDTDDYSWLRYFLAPMQDGQFISGSSVHSLPRCILVFAGGVSKDLETMMHQQNCEKLKIPDFVSRLHGLQTVWGVNLSEDGDKQRMYIVRRAIILKYNLEKLFGKDIKLDEALQYALLHVKVFLHGARSIERFCNAIVPDGPIINVACLPTDGILRLFFDTKEFWSLYSMGLEIMRSSDVFGKAIHTKYNELQEAHFAQHGKYMTLIQKVRPWDELDEEGKYQNIEPIWHLEARLNRHEYQLNMGGLPENCSFDQEEIDQMACEEHTRWMACAIMRGTHFGYSKHDGARKTPRVSPYLVDCKTLEQLKLVETGDSSFVLDKKLAKLQVGLIQESFTVRKKEKAESSSIATG